MKLRRVVIAVAVGAAVSVTASARPSAASTPDRVCEISPVNEFCLWQDANYNAGHGGQYGGNQYQWTIDDGDYRNNKWVGTNDVLDNEASSAQNGSYVCGVRLYQNVGATGLSYWFNPQRSSN